VSPRRAPAPCTYPGCPNLVDKGRCPEHRVEDRAQYEHRPEDRARKRIYNSPRWRRLRSEIVQLRGIWCQAEGCPNLGTDLDHIRPLREILELGLDPFDPANVQLLCKRHHSEKTAAEVFRRSAGG